MGWLGHVARIELVGLIDMRGVFIKSKHEPYFRCGHRHSVEGCGFADGVFTKAQLTQLRADPYLIVEDVEFADDENELKKQREADNKDALAREKKAIKADRKAWEAATATAIETGEMSAEDFAALQPADRVRIIESIITPVE